MSTLQELLNTRRGGYRAVYKGIDLGELADTPEIKAGYDAENFVVQTQEFLSRTCEGAAELYATVKLPVKMVETALELLDGDLSIPGELCLRNTFIKRVHELRFPECRLLPSWEFSPSVTGMHILIMKFMARTGTDGKLFYFSSRT